MVIMRHSMMQMWQDLEATGIDPVQHFIYLLFGSDYKTHPDYKDLVLRKFVGCSYMEELIIALLYWADKQRGYAAGKTSVGNILMNRIKGRAFSQGISVTTYIEELFASRNADDFIWRLEM